MKIAAHNFAALVDAAASVARAMARLSILRNTKPERGLARRITRSAVALHEELEAMHVLQVREGRWYRAMRRVRSIPLARDVRRV